MPSFEYEPLVLSPKLETSNEEKGRGDTWGRIIKYKSSRTTKRP
jgi:hypothetical protein